MRLLLHSDRDLKKKKKNPTHICFKKAVEPHAMPGILFLPPQSKFALLKQQLQATAGELCFAVVILAVALIYICNIWKMCAI